MKKYLSIILVSTVCLSTTSFAMEKEPPFDDTAKMAEIHKAHEKIVAQLDLSAEQMAKMKELRESSKAKIEPILTEMKQLREKAKALREEGKKEFESVLTSEQLALFKKLRAETHKNRSRGERAQAEKK